MKTLGSTGLLLGFAWLSGKKKPNDSEFKGATEQTGRCLILAILRGLKNQSPSFHRISTSGMY